MIDILQNNLDKINWEKLSQNGMALNILQNNTDKINWCNLSKNPSIFTDELMPNII